MKTGRCRCPRVAGGLFSCFFPLGVVNRQFSFYLTHLIHLVHFIYLIYAI